MSTKRFCDFCDEVIRENQATFDVVLRGNRGTTSDYIKDFDSCDVCAKCANQIQRTIWQCGVKEVEK